MKPTVAQLYAVAGNILSNLVETTSTVNDECNVRRAVELAQMLAAAIPDTDPMPEPQETKKVLQQIFGEVDGRAISKTQLSNAIQARMETGRRNADNIILWAETEKIIKGDARGNGINYTLA